MGVSNQDVVARMKNAPWFIEVGSKDLKSWHNVRVRSRIVRWARK